MVTALFTHTVHGEEKNCTCVEKCMVQIEKKEYNQKKKKKERKYTENYCNCYTAEFSTIFVMKQDFDIGVLGYHCKHPIIKFQINSSHNKQLNYRIIRFCIFNNLKNTVKM